MTAGRFYLQRLTLLAFKNNWGRRRGRSLASLNGSFVSHRSNEDEGSWVWLVVVYATGVGDAAPCFDQCFTHVRRSSQRFNRKWCQLLGWSDATSRTFPARAIYRHLFLAEIGATPTSIRQLRCHRDRNKITVSVALVINTSRHPTFTRPSLKGSQPSAVQFSRTCRLTFTGARSILRLEAYRFKFDVHAVFLLYHLAAQMCL